MTKTPKDMDKCSEEDELGREGLLIRLDAWFSGTFLYDELRKEEQAYKQIKELIQKPRVAEEWYEEKAIELNNEILLGSWRKDYYIMCKDFIRSLVEEIQRVA